MRASLLASASVSLVVLAGAVIATDAAAQDVPVQYGTDPGFASKTVRAPVRSPVRTSPMIVGEAAASASVATAAAPESRPYTSTPRMAAIEEVGRVIRVEPGDTVYGIGRRHGVTPTSLIEANRLEAPYQLKVGQEIILPTDSAVETRTAQAPAPQTAPQPAPQASASHAAVSAEQRQPQAIATSAPQRLEYDEDRKARFTARAETIEAAAPKAKQRSASVERLDALYTVRPGDTLYSLSRRFEIDLEDLATANGLAAPYNLSINQRIVIPGAVSTGESRAPLQHTPSRSAAVEPYAGPTPDAKAAARELGVAPEAFGAGEQPERIVVSKAPESRFAWPIRGTIVKNYGMNEEGLRNDGINIAAPVGSPVRASADGEVIYTGAELEGYGNLLLIRHNDGWVSAYAHTDSIVVRKGDQVQQGQVVAKVGRTGSVEQPQLHFELRHELQPRDPLAALEGRDMKAAMLQ